MVGKTTVSKAAAPKGQRYQNNDLKCSVDVGAKARNQRSEDGGGTAPRGGPARDAKFQKGGTNRSAKSTISVSFYISKVPDILNQM